MKLRCKLNNVTFDMSNIWIDEEAFKEITPEEWHALIKEDLLAFLEEIPGGLLSHCEFFVAPKETQ